MLETNSKKLKKINLRKNTDGEEVILKDSFNLRHIKKE